MLYQLSYTHRANLSSATGPPLNSIHGAPEGIRSPDPRLRRPLLCPPELLAWSGRADLNGRPPAPKAGALPGCATPRHLHDGRSLARAARVSQCCRPSGGEMSAERAHGACAMADAGLLGGGRLGKGVPQLVGQEDRIVAEPAPTDRRFDDDPGAGALRRLDATVGPRQRHHAPEAPTPVAGGREACEERRDAFAVGRGQA